MSQINESTVDMGSQNSSQAVCRQTSVPCETYGDFIRKSLHALSSKIDAILAICSENRNDWMEVQLAVDKAASYVRDNELTEARYKLVVSLPKVEELSKKKNSDPFLQATFAAVFRDFKAVQQNGFDKLIKICKTGVGLPICFSNVNTEQKKFLKMTPEALRDYCFEMGDTDTFEVIAKLYDRLYYKESMHFESPDCTPSSLVFSDHPDWCVYCLLRVPHCMDAPGKFEACCVNSDCLGNHSIPELFVLAESYHLTPQRVALIQLYRFAVMVSWAEEEDYQFTFDFPHEGEKAFDYPIMRAPNLEAHMKKHVLQSLNEEDEMMEYVPLNRPPTPMPEDSDAFSPERSEAIKREL